MTNRRYAWAGRWLLLVIAVGIGLAYLAIVWRVGGGRPVAPLDDSYIFYQYARQIARGAPWRYNDGDPPSRGMTSLLYPWMLAGFYRLGWQGERLVWVAMLSGVLWLSGIAFCSARLWEALAFPLPRARRWGTIAALVVLCTGIVQWGAFAGMETGLFTLLTLMALDAVLRGRALAGTLWLGLAGFTRPEGLFLAGIAWLITFVDQVATSSARSRLRTLGRAFVATLPLGIAVLAGLLPSLLNWLITGTATSAGIEAKSWFYNVPQRWGDILRSVLLGYGRVFLRILNGWGPGHEISGGLVAPGLTVMALLGWGALALYRRWRPLFLTAAWFWGGTLSTATLITATWHLGRYQAPFVPIAAILAVAGIAALWEGVFCRANLGRVAAALMLAWLMAGSLLSTYHALVAFRQTTRTMIRQQLVLADWLRDNLPPDARVGVHDTGSLRYVGGRPTYDLIGLTTAETTRAWRNGMGSVFERMERSPYRPDYFAIYPDVFSIPYLVSTDLFARQLFRVEVSEYAVVSAGPVQGVWQADWRLAGSGERMVQADVLARVRGLSLVDALDVADLDDEAAHQLRWWHGSAYGGFPTEVYQMRYHAPPNVEVLDGGRLVSGGMRFQVATQPGQALYIVARLHAQQAGAVQVTVDGRPIGRWAFPGLPGAWLETVFSVPAGAVSGERTEVRLDVEEGVDRPARYVPYYFWFLQGTTRKEAVRIAHPLDVRFDRGIRLQGFDLERDVLSAGQVLSTTLYWKVDALVDSDAKVFLHLYDAQGNLGPQADGWPVFGTRPPYTWQIGETVDDRRTLTLPPDLPPGRYALDVGLYDQSGRLTPIPEGGQAFHENRVPLTQIEVRELD